MSLSLFCCGGNVSLVTEALLDCNCLDWFRDWLVSTGVEEDDGLARAWVDG